MRLVDYLDKGASLGEYMPCLGMDGRDMSYREVQRLSWRIARRLSADVKAGNKVAILSSNDPVAFASVFGLSRAGVVWCPINPRNEASENQFILDAFDCVALFFHSHYATTVEKIRSGLPKVKILVCLDAEFDFAPSLETWLGETEDSPFDVDPVDDVIMIAGTGGTTGKPKGVMLTGRNVESMSALTLMGYPFQGRPCYLAMAPLTHAAGILCMPIMALGGRIVIMSRPDIGEFLGLIETHRVTHTFLPPTLIYMALDHHALARTNLNSLQCFWYGAAPMSPARLARALEAIGPMGQLFGQTEAPMMISMMAPRDHYRADGSVAVERLSSAGRVSPLVQLRIMDKDGTLLPRGERGEIVIRGSLVMAGYYKNSQATAEASAHGWHHTGDIGYVDEDNFLYIVDRAKDMIITGGFNVYSVEVEQALSAHDAIADCAVLGLPDDKWGERIVAVVQPKAGGAVDVEVLKTFVKARLGSVKTPKQIEVWADLPRSKIGKVLKSDIRATLLASAK